jgi:hypothetical protein
MNDLGMSRRHGRGMKTGCHPLARRFDTHQRDTFVLEEVGKQADRVAASADACDEGVGQSAFGLKRLSARLTSDD